MEKTVRKGMKTPLTKSENPPNTEYLGSELDELLAKAVARGEALKMPKPKLHWKQARRKRLEASRAHELRPGRRRYRERVKTCLRQRYHHLKREVGKRGIGWELAMSDWLMAWLMAKPAKRGGIDTPAFLATGRGKGDVKLRRIDSSKPYSKENIEIVQGDRRLFP